MRLLQGLSQSRIFSFCLHHLLHQRLPKVINRLTSLRLLMHRLPPWLLYNFNIDNSSLSLSCLWSILNLCFAIGIFRSLLGLLFRLLICLLLGLFLRLFFFFSRLLGLRLLRLGLLRLSFLGLGFWLVRWLFRLCRRLHLGI
jgi:hypothetical protein